MNSDPLPLIRVFSRQRKIPVATIELEEFARRAFPLCAREPGDALRKLEEISIILVSNRGISELHRQFMGIEGATDVITFHHGDIFISVETAQHQARSYKTSLDYELCLYLIHGFLHLQGFDDTTPGGRRVMKAAQERILNRLERQER